MSILGKYTDNLIDEDELSEEVTSGFTTPVVIKKDSDDNLKKAITISAILHPVVLGSIYLISLILLFLGISFVKFDKPKPKVQDIEFVLVDKEDTPINKKTPYRSDMNSRAGGHHDPKKKVSMPSPAPSAKASQPAAQQQPSKPQKKQAQQQPQPIKKPTIAEQIQQTMNKTVTPKPQPKPQPAAPKAPQEAKPQPPTARPSIKPPLTPKPVAKPSSAFQVPVPSGGTKGGTYATGPISGSGTSANGGGSGGSSSGSTAGTGRYSPAPSLAPTGGGSSGDRLAKGGGGGSGGGNPGPGNPNGRPGIDTVREPDFGPYMRDLQRRIKMNWDPPKGNESKRVVLLFKIAKSGALLSCSVYKSSGIPSADKAALNAVRLTAPFKPLPPDYKGASIDIQFTFDYNVFGASGYN